MPLPENWDGFFYSPETGAELIADLDASAFAEIAIANDRNPAFLFAGAVFDLTLNGMAEQANRYLEFAKSRWPEAPWPRLEKILAELKGHPPRTWSLVKNSVGPQINLAFGDY